MTAWHREEKGTTMLATCREKEWGSTAACVYREPVRVVVAARGMEPALAASVWRQGLGTK